MAGSGVYWDDAAKELAALAERAGVPVFMNGAGRGSLPHDHPQAFAQARGFALGQADVVARPGHAARLPAGLWPAAVLRRERRRWRWWTATRSELGRNRPLAVGLASHIGLTLRALADALPRDLAARTQPWLAAVRKKETDSQARLMAERRSDDVPISHYRLGHEIAAVVDAETTVVGDGGDVVGCAVQDRAALAPGPVARSRALRLPRRRALLRDRGQAAAAVAERVLLIAGDGAFGLNGMEMETAVRFGLPMTVVIGNDGGWGQIRNPQLSFFGAERAVGTSLPFTRFERMVEALGGKGIHVTEPGQLRPGAGARARLGGGLLRQRGAGPGRVPAHRPGLDGRYEDHVPLPASPDRGRGARDPHPRRPARPARARGDRGRPGSRGP